MGTVTFERRDAVAIITLENPPLNAITIDMIGQFSTCLRAIEAEAGVRAVVIRGMGDQHFTAGADLSEMAVAPKADGSKHAQRVRGWLTGIQAVFEQIERSPKVFFCAMKGLAYGGGLELAAACDIRVAAESTRLGMPEVKMGLMPGFGGTQRIARLVGRGPALAMMLMAEPIDAATAHRLGLVDVLTAPGQAEETALKMAMTVSGFAPLALASVKKAVNEGMKLDQTTASRLEVDLFARVSTSEDAREGVRAFVEKRQPIFHGR